MQTREKALAVTAEVGKAVLGKPEAILKIMMAMLARGHVLVEDTPSGTNSTDGSVVNAVKADYTIAISTLKFAHVLPASNSYCGKIYTVNIGIDESHYKNNYARTITKKDIKKNFNKRDFNSNKGSFGKKLNCRAEPLQCKSKNYSAAGH